MHKRLNKKAKGLSGVYITYIFLFKGLSSIERTHTQTVIHRRWQKKGTFTFWCCGEVMIDYYMHIQFMHGQE